MDTRQYWIQGLCHVAKPVLSALSQNSLRTLMPVEAAPGVEDVRRKSTHLEALGRVLCGIAPWLELEEISAEEAVQRDAMLMLALSSLVNAVDPDSPDRMSFDQPGQALVDSAFLAQGLLRSPRAVWSRLDPVTQSRLVDGLRSSRKILPGFSNWLLFSATIEAFFRSIGEDWDRMRVDYALRQHEQWYCGDGAYSDGPEFHWDYYNSYVIQPMVLDVLKALAGEWHADWLRESCVKRGRRFAAVQERMIAPDGSFPPLGRSLAYRGGAFHHLARAALEEQLPEELPPEQVRCALTAVLQRTLDAPGTFDPDGWLTIGLAGHQPALGEHYISTGSLYLCCAIYLPLGLPAGHAFWAGAPSPWTSRKIWEGADQPADRAI